jgi:ABC-type transport system involved in multi-copper enzyme maturation permease subunit
MTATLTPYTSTAPAGSDGFGRLLRAEWTKFRTVRGWVIATGVAAILMILFAALQGLGSHSSFQAGPDSPAITGHPYIPLGPGGQAVTDTFYFAHQPLAGDATITTRITSLTGATLGNAAGAGAGPALTAGAVQPWAKAGLIVKVNTSQGSAYAAIMITGGHGVRMQDNYTGDIAGPAGTVSAAAPRWLRLTRHGDSITGYASSDGTAWTTVGTVRLRGLPTTAQAGLFVASPAALSFSASLGGSSEGGRGTVASATFDSLGLPAGWSATEWTGTAIGKDSADTDSSPNQSFTQDGGTVTVTGNGDIAPDTGDSGSIDHVLVGAFAALTTLVVLGVLFITTEYRRGLIRTSLTTSPRRGRLLAAKAVVLATVTFVVGLVGSAIAVPIGEHILSVNGNFVAPVSVLTWMRIVCGTAGLLAVASVLALAIGTILRRSAASVAAGIVVVVLPYVLGTAGVLPAGAANWLLRVTPAAGFAIQQSVPAYPQVDSNYLPTNGFYPLSPWVGFAVLCAWAAAALGLAAYLLRRRDA